MELKFAIIFQRHRLRICSPSCLTQSELALYPKFPCSSFPSPYAINQRGQVRNQPPYVRWLTPALGKRLSRMCLLIFHLMAALALGELELAAFFHSYNLHIYYVNLHPLGLDDKVQLPLKYLRSYLVP